MILTGGCLCGAVRYRIEGDLADEGAGFCHCRVCQRSSGAPVVAWGTFRTADFRFTQGQPAEFRSSPKGVRQFCPACGTQLTFAYTEGPAVLDVTLASLDDPALIVPEYHSWTSSAVPWLKLVDDLPRHADGGGDFTPY
jgi:hypothetical protein